ncbi:MAG: gamma-glutamylcyclotransferase [Polyangiaceae bacterium]|nr:gamma-glutamylcyclotransferase [Polyangiaceae bacterium]
MSKKESWLFDHGFLAKADGLQSTGKEVGRIQDYRRAVAVDSTTDWGSPDKPGRLPTLIAKEGVLCEGIAYRVSEAAIQALHSKLEESERSSTELKRLNFECRDTGAGPQSVYALVALDESSFFRQEEPIGELVDAILEARGSKGSNLEVILEWIDTMHEFEIDDDASYELANQLLDPHDLLDDIDASKLKGRRR